MYWKIITKFSDLYFTKRNKPKYFTLKTEQYPHLADY